MLHECKHQGYTYALSLHPRREWLSVSCVCIGFGHHLRKPSLAVLRGMAMSIAVVCAPTDDPDIFIRPCVDCGLITCNFCECTAEVRIPDEYWEDGQVTPFCNSCDDRFAMCHFCRGLSWCRPKAIY